MTHPHDTEPYDRIHVGGRRPPNEPRVQSARVLSSRDGAFHFVSENKDLKSSGFCALNEAPPRTDLSETRGRPLDLNGGELFATPSEQPKPAGRKRAIQQRADQKMQMAILDRLKEVLVDNGDGTYSYKEPWDDKAVSVALGCKIGHVTYRRRNAFGPFPDSQPAPDPFGERALRLVLNLYRELGVTVPD
jgi:hypothetical protein